MRKNDKSSNEEESFSQPKPKRSKKQKRRGRGTGTIYWREDRNRWVADLLLDNGKRKTVTGRTYKEVEEKLLIARNEQRQGKLLRSSRQTLRQYLEQWFEEVHKHDVRKSTYIKHSIVLKKHIIPALGHIQLQKLTPQDVHRFYVAKGEEKLASATIRKMHNLLHKALKNAVLWELLPQNVCDRVKPPRVVHRESQALTKEQAIRLLRVVRGHKLEALITLALTTGMRHGELLALRWHDINFEEKSLYVCHSVTLIGGHGYIEGDPKTEKSKRTIMLPQFVVEGLKLHRLRQLEVRLQAGLHWKNNDLVFCDRDGNFLNPNMVRRWFYRLLEEAGLPRIRLHDLRHSAATLLILVMKYPSKLVQELLGHSKVDTTENIYTHADLAMQRQMMDDLHTFFEGSF